MASIYIEQFLEDILLFLKSNSEFMMCLGTLQKLDQMKLIQEIAEPLKVIRFFILI